MRLTEDSDTLPPTAEQLAELDGPDGEPLTAEAHTGCPGHVATWAENPQEPGEVNYFCTDPDRFGHRPPQEDVPETDDEADVQPTEAVEEAKSSEPSREYVKAGNKAYRAAEKARQSWLKDLIGRKSAPKPLAAFITEQPLTCPKPVAQWSGDVGRHNLIKELWSTRTGAPLNPPLRPPLPAVDLPRPRTAARLGEVPARDMAPVRPRGALRTSPRAPTGHHPEIG
ncbi:hypothetical protein [Streptomyces sp. Root1310]|uniref:hypothetical protein n=1 Tax=Streptomyces sp. Root1310 TaxID=1736452 RepID=UPI00070C9DC5|nr:hypothetical protein [Streptomyces sp. Root1310]KQX73081.1 hypothetical protein ASD48_39170 [Streptomyces sp. Root1310]